jgi:hypothetical protein
VPTGQVEQNRAALVKQFGYPSPIVEGHIGNQPAGKGMIVAHVVADIRAGEKVCHVFGDAR